ncbi:hypothetical protein LZZ90_08395 [Flavobacterium sp. SM15]|uniref:hypothetical protein n=1 Tax=Flavobacterium sp. SM15 TaxID=2908005 RepID=UPI001EDBBB50|nr:hypothetical protein [Flavobacterium sp. SM15]MCG2611526.1 hypothetical protein [Flavobacterium sp. SM15]
MTYVVTYYTTDSQNESFIKDFEFENENLIIARREAIAKAKGLEAAAAKDEKIKTFAIDIWLYESDEDEDINTIEIQLMGGDSDGILAELNNEFELYLNNDIQIETVEIDKYEVIAEDINYLLNS